MTLAASLVAACLAACAAWVGVIIQWRVAARSSKKDEQFLRGQEAAENRSLNLLRDCIDSVVATAGNALELRPVLGGRGGEAETLRAQDHMLSLWAELSEMEARNLADAYYRSFFPIKQAVATLYECVGTLLGDPDLRTSGRQALHSRISALRTDLLEARIKLA
jgi:hypothetical protein